MNYNSISFFLIIVTGLNTINLTRVRLRCKFALASGTYQVFLAFSICIKLMNCENVYFPPSSVELFLIWRHNDSALFQSLRYQTDFPFFRDHAIGSCFIKFAIQWLAFIVLVDICTSEKCISNYEVEHLLWDFENDPYRA